jgi:hypothetical protein
MATIKIETASRKEANAVLSKVYEKDSSGVFCNGKRTVISDSLTANIVENTNVEIYSNFYNEVSLREMFQ